MSNIEEQLLSSLREDHGQTYDVDGIYQQLKSDYDNISPIRILELMSSHNCIFQDVADALLYEEFGDDDKDSDGGAFNINQGNEAEDDDVLHFDTDDDDESVNNNDNVINNENEDEALN